MSQLGVVVDGYTISELIGRGGSSSVYQAHQEAFDRDVAIKVLDVDPRDEEARRRFIRECVAAGKVSAHPNIVTILDSGVVEDGRPYLTTELCPGGSLAERSRARGPLPVDEVLQIGVKLSGALATAHAAGILHRDLKPDNVLVTAFGEPALTDFGISTVGGQAPSTTTRGSYTLHHAPPETLSGGDVTVAADIYALCSTLHHLIVGHAPFGADAGAPLATVVNRIMHEPPPPLGRSEVPSSLETLLATGMAKDPADRIPTAEALGEALRAVQREQGLAATELVILQSSTGATLPADGAVGAVVGATVVRRGGKPVNVGPAADPAASTPGDPAPPVPVVAAPPAPPPSSPDAVADGNVTVVGKVRGLAPTPPAVAVEAGEGGARSRVRAALVAVVVLLIIGAGLAAIAVSRSGDDTAITKLTVAHSTSTSTAAGQTTTTSGPGGPTTPTEPGAGPTNGPTPTTPTTPTAGPIFGPTASTKTTRVVPPSGTGPPVTTRPVAPTTPAASVTSPPATASTTAPLRLAVTSIKSSPAAAPCGANPTLEVILTWTTTLASSVTIGIDSPSVFEQGLSPNGSLTLPYQGCNNGNGKVTYYVIAMGLNGVDATTSTVVVNASA